MKRRVFRFLLLAALFVLLLVVVCELVVKSAGRGRIYTDTALVPARRVGVVLGAGQGSRYYRWRLDAAAELFKAGRVEFLLASGDNNNVNYDEVTAMKRDLVRRGVSAEKIYCDYAGFRTLDSMVRAKKVFGLDECIVISQPFHCERALFLANGCGLDAVGFAARDVTGLESVRTLVRERFARVAACLDRLTGRAPKFLGPPVRIGLDPAPSAEPNH